MSHRSELIHDVFLVRWIDPRPEDVTKVVQDIKLARAQVGKSVHFLAVIPHDCKIPQEDTRAAMQRSMESLVQNVSDTFYVVEGSGFKHSILRSALTGVLLVTNKLGKSAVHPSVDEALSKMAVDEGIKERIRTAMERMKAPVAA